MYGVYDILKFIKVFTHLLTITLNVEPCSDVTVLVSLAVPKPFTAIYLHLSVAENAGIGTFVLCILLAKHLLKGRRCCRLTTIVVSLIVGDRDIAIATTKDVESEHTAFDMHKSITINNTVGATTIYTVPYHRSDTLHTRLVGIGNMQYGITIYSSYLIIFRSICLLQTLTSCKYFTKDVTANDVDKRLIVCSLIAYKVAVILVEGRSALRLIVIISFWIIMCFIRTNISHIATAIYISIYMSVICHFNLCSFIHLCYISEIDIILRLHACTAAEYIAIDISTFYVYFGIATNLTSFVVACRFWVTESTTIYTMNESLAVYCYLGVFIHSTCISAS